MSFDSNCSQMASPILVHRVASPFSPRTNSIAYSSESLNNAGGSDLASGPSVLEIISLAPEHREFAHLNIPDDCKEVLANACAPSTIKTYSMKWKRFCTWCETANLHPLEATPEQILPFFLHLARLGLSHSTLKVFLAAISRYRQDGSTSLYSSRIIQQFFKGLFRMFPPIWRPPPAWHLNVVLAQFMRHPFEPIHKADLKHVTWKVSLLLALTSAKRVSDIQAFTIEKPFLLFSPSSVILRTNPSFMPKVPSDFHLNYPVTLKTFFPDPQTPAERSLHTLDVKRCIKFYLQWTSSCRKSSQLFVAYGRMHQGQPVSKPTIARWITETIVFCHQQAGRPLSSPPHAHSTRAVSSSTALFAGVPLDQICRAATWSSLHTFTKHYCLEAASDIDTSVGQAVLRNLFQ